MKGNYLKKYYLDDTKLAQRARLEFARAMRTRRMTAFVGSMGTQAFGYGTWAQLRMQVAYLAKRVILSMRVGSESGSISDQAKKKALENIAFLDAKANARQITPDVAMSLMEEVLDSPDIRSGRVNQSHLKGLMSTYRWPLDQVTSPLGHLKMLLANAFRKPNNDWSIVRESVGVEPSDFDSNFNVPWLLWSQLGIRRYVTTNYDFELERMAMLTGASGRRGRKIRSAFEELTRKRTGPESEMFSWDLGSGRIRRVFDDGWAIESDLLNRERIDRMIEFAVGTDDYDGHILHLHGRADDWRSMIVSLRDYDRLYRHNDLNRAPFELAKRMMMAGNPILFVGLGMTEQALNRELEEFISNNPYQRVAPAFVLWSVVPAAMDANAKRAKRLDLLRRLGVMTIFDDEIGGLVSASEDHFKLAGGLEEIIGKDFNTSLTHVPLPHDRQTILGSTVFDEVDKNHYMPMLEALAKGVTALSQSSSNCPSIREEFAEAPWRSRGMEKKFSGGAQAVVLWDDDLDGNAEEKEEKKQDTLGFFNIGSPSIDNVVSSQAMACIIGPQGCGKGQASRAVMHKVNENPSNFGISSADRCLVVHGNFSFDTDSLLDAIAQFFQLHLGGDNKWRDGQNGVPNCSRNSYFKSLELDKPVRKSEALIVINGMERFSGINGQMLSAELDELLRLSFKGAAKNKVGSFRKNSPRVRWLLFGTERVRKYAKEIGASISEFDHIFPTEDPRLNQNQIPNWYLRTLSKNMEFKPDEFPAELKQAIRDYAANSAGRISGDSIEVRKAFFGYLFSDHNMAKAIAGAGAVKDSVEIARKLLRALAFVGSPTELGVLMRMPQLAAWNDDGDKRVGVEKVLDELCQKKLILKLKGFAAYEPAIKTEINFRYALHRSVLTELRYRFGIPLNEAKLSTAFNMSLYVAQPLDGDIPDSDIHDELGDTIDALIGGYLLHANLSKQTADTILENVATRPDVNINDFTQWLETASTQCVASGGAHSTREAQLRVYHLCRPEHVQGLRAALSLIRSYYSTTGLLTLNSGDRLIREDRDGILLEHAERLDDLIDAYGKIALARKSLRNSISDDAEFKKIFGDAEPFYADELVWLHNERGVVRLAMGDLYEAEFSFIRAMDVNQRWVERNDRDHNWRRIRLNQLTVDMERGRLGAAERKIAELEAVTEATGNAQSDEHELAMGIAAGYSGWAKHLRGQFSEARAEYDKALKIFRDLDEARAAAYFHRLRVDVLDRETSPVERRPDIVEAIQLAQASRQMDIVHRLNIKLADELVFGNNTTKVDRSRGQRLLEDAMTYALQTDVHRVRCEAAIGIANTRHATGDYEGALRYAMDAMMVACRYGMELRKISLRALVAKIMAERGDPITARHLAKTCIKMATRQRYENAIDGAEKVLLSLPRMSKAITGTDLSGQRRY